MDATHGVWTGAVRTTTVAAPPQIDDEPDLRRGPWTVEEDIVLINYISVNGEGRWNSLARCAGLRRTGKSCRLRWLNYLRPDIRRGNITPKEQLLILELHSRWGNRWSKIAQHLPGRTDNEIKNYWRTRVQKHAKQLQCDVNSKQFEDIMRYIWMPRLLERIQAANAAVSATTTTTGEQSMAENNCVIACSSSSTQVAPVTSAAGDGNWYSGYNENLATTCVYHYNQEFVPAVAPDLKQQNGGGDVQDSFWSAMDEFW